MPLSDAEITAIEEHARQIERVMLQVRLPKELVKQLDHACVDWERTRAALVEQLLREGLPRYQGPRGYYADASP